MVGRWKELRCSTASWVFRLVRRMVQSPLLPAALRMTPYMRRPVIQPLAEAVKVADISRQSFS